MSGITRTRCGILCLMLAGLGAWPQWTLASEEAAGVISEADAGLIPVSAFAALPEMSAPRLSPDGSKLLYLRPIEDTYHAAVVDLKTARSSLVMAANPEEFLINWCRWANNSRIVCSIRYYAELQAGQVDARVVRRYRERRTTFTRMIAVDVDGKNQLQLVRRPSNRPSGDTQWNAVDQDNVVSWLRDDREHVLIAINRDERTRPSVYRLNIYTNRMKQVRRHHDSVLSWYADHSGTLRFAAGYRQTTPVAFSVDGKRRIHEMDLSRISSDIAPGFQGLSADGTSVYFASYHSGGTRKLFSIAASGEGEPKTVLEIDDYDYFGTLSFHPTRGDLMLAQYFTETSGQRWFDTQLQDRLEIVFTTLHGIHQNVRLVSMDDDLNRFVFNAEGRGTAPTYYLYDATDKALKILAVTYRRLPGVVDSEVVTYSARDGYPIVAYLTRPEGDRPLPTVIVPHGGPNARDYPLFDYWTQFLVSRGYAVLQPNFRGSIGYGAAHLRLGFEQWGLRMQDDVVDGLDWLIEESIADPDRVCFVGGSYGGYVALTAAFKIPERIKCAVSFAGVTDLGHLKKHYGQYDLGELALARIQSGASVSQNSPIKQIEALNVPLLIVHGELDRSVMIEHSRNLVEALQMEGKTYRYLEQESGDHFLSRQSHRLEFLEALDEFLAEYLQPPDG